MVVNFSIINNIKINTVVKMKKFYNGAKSYILTNNTLTRDTFEPSKRIRKESKLSNYPHILIDDFNSGVRDSRFNVFSTEYRAYDYEGCNNRFPDNYVLIDSKGERRLKPHVYLKMVEIKPKFARKGAYKYAIKKLVEVSKKSDCEGRIILFSTSLEGPDVAEIPAPSLAHWKCGFRFANEEKNKLMQRVLSGEIPRERAPRGTMYYAGI